MKKRIKKRLSFLLLTLLGFSTACEKQKNGEPPTAMYGTPHVNIWVGGKVTDKTGTPIPGIEVRQQNSSYKAQTGDDGCYELPGLPCHTVCQAVFSKPPRLLPHASLLLPDLQSGLF